MFTGIVEEIGRIASVEEIGNGVELVVEAARVLEGTEIGDSIAIDGVCQTVVALRPDGFTVQAIATTLSRTTFGEYRPSRRVNLERAVAVGQRLGGHLVQGHVDATGHVESVETLEELVLIDVAVPEEVAAVTILHGSITINGISLTVNALPRRNVVQVAIIPHTWDQTNIQDLRPGDAVNLEGDLIGKYVRQLLGAPAAAGADAGSMLRGWGYETG
jgi:riboflavin synthase